MKFCNVVWQSASCELVLSTGCELRVDNAKCELVHLKCELRVRLKASNFHPFKQKNWDFLEDFCKSRDFKKILLMFINSKFHI